MDAKSVNINLALANVKLKFRPYIERVHVESAIATTKLIFNENSPEIKLTEKAIVDAKRLADEMGAKTIVLFFPYQPLIYYKEIFGSEPPESFFDVAVIKHMKEFCKNIGVGYIDMYLPLLDQVNNVIAMGNINLAKLPYFQKDPHMNEVGQKIIAKEVLNYFINQKKKSIFMNQ